MPVATDLEFPASFAFLPNGHILYGELVSGEIHFLNRWTGRHHLFFHVPGVRAKAEQGLLGVALHPEYPRRPFVYAYATRDVRGGPHNQVLRIREEGGRGTSMRVLYSQATGGDILHHGGRILFGPDGQLYLSVGYGQDAANAQDLGRPAGKILRVRRDGSASVGNPFHEDAGADGRIWAFGFRNSFGFDFDPRTGRLWATDNGPECNDELNLVGAGRNYGWGPRAECSEDDIRSTNRDGPDPVLPRWSLSGTFGPTGVAFCERCGLGRVNEGRLLLGAYNTGRIRSVRLSASRWDVLGTRIVFQHSSGILAIEASPQGTLFFSDPEGIHRLTMA